MSKNIIETFYNAFQAKDYTTMKSCYHKDAIFSDEVFSLQGDDIGWMWHMLCEKGKDLVILYTINNENEDKVNASWEAFYTFSQTKRKVHNKINASFIIKDGKIIEHRDSFSFYRWSIMALGFTGTILGWTSFLKNKVRSNAMNSLHHFIKKNS